MLAKYLPGRHEVRFCCGNDLQVAYAYTRADGWISAGINRAEGIVPGSRWLLAPEQVIHPGNDGV